MMKKQQKLKSVQAVKRGGMNKPPMESLKMTVAGPMSDVHLHLSDEIKVIFRAVLLLQHVSTHKSG